MAVFYGWNYGFVPFYLGDVAVPLPLQGVSQSIPLMRAHVCYLIAIRWRR